MKEVEQDFIKNETFAYLRKNLENSEMYATFLILENVLKIFNKYNVFFQSKHNKVHSLSQKFLHEIGNKFLTSIVMTSLKNNWDLSSRINFEATGNQLCLDRVKLGAACECTLQLMESEAAKKIRENARIFLITTVKGIVMRLFICDEFLTKLQTLEMDNALNQWDREESLKNLKFISGKLSSCGNLKGLEAEWRKLPFEDAISSELLSNVHDEVEFEEFWKIVMKLRDEHGSPEYPDLTVLVSAVMTLPHSNADAERAFSMLTEFSLFFRSTSSQCSSCVSGEALLKGTVPSRDRKKAFFPDFFLAKRNIADIRTLGYVLVIF